MRATLGAPRGGEVSGLTDVAVVEAGDREPAVRECGAEVVRPRDHLHAEAHDEQ